MPESMSLGRLLALAVCAVPLASAAGCPHVRGNQAREDAVSMNDPRSALEARFSPDGPDFGRCPRQSKEAGGGTRSQDWWPCELSLDVLRQNGPLINPLGGDFDYASEFSKLDVDELKKDLTELQTSSQPWWPADFGNYGPLLIRLAWHNAGTYRAIDGRGGSGMGQQRFAPLNSWPDNAGLDKARRLLLPIKQKYGSKLSWADLMVFAGNNALENMGFPTYGFAFGRVDTWQADEGIYWGREHAMFSDPRSSEGRYNGSTDIFARADGLEAPLASTNMGLIYVDPEGPDGNPDPSASALDIREAFGRMAMDDEETIALIAGGHAFGKTHGAVAAEFIGPEPNNASLEFQGLGWHNSFNTGVGNNSFSSGLEVIWSTTPTKWANEFLISLFKNNWTLVESPGGAHQWEALDAPNIYPDPFIKGKFRKPTMMTSDLALLHDKSFKNISQTFHDDFDYFTQTFALAWYKLLHRDMGPMSRYLGPDIPKKAPLIWQDPIPKATYGTINDDDVAKLKTEILAAPGLNISNLVTTAWGAASSFRISDKRGGANGGRIALEPQNTFAANNPARVKAVLSALNGVKNKFNSASKSRKVSLADLIVLGGSAAVEAAAKAAGSSIKVPFTPGRVDTTQDLTDIPTFKFLEPQADGFRNFGHGDSRSLTEEILVDKANQLSLSPPELTVVIGGMRALNANFDGSDLGILTKRPGQLTNDYFVNLLNMSTAWSSIPNSGDELFAGKELTTGKPLWTATRADLIFGSHPELRAVAEVYSASDAQSKFVSDFVTAFVKVMELDRYDIKGRAQNDVQ